ncbi:MAG: hypothetical protein ACRETN_13125 [Nevskiales bacterium]
MSLIIPARTAFACAGMDGAVLNQCCCEEIQLCQADHNRCAEAAADEACCSLVTVQSDEQAVKASSAGDESAAKKGKSPTPDIGLAARARFVFAASPFSLAAAPGPSRVWQSGCSLYLTTARLRI